MIEEGATISPAENGGENLLSHQLLSLLFSDFVGIWYAGVRRMVEVHFWSKKRSRTEMIKS